VVYTRLVGAYGDDESRPAHGYNVIDFKTRYRDGCHTAWMPCRSPLRSACGVGDPVRRTKPESTDRLWSRWWVSLCGSGWG